MRCHHIRVLLAVSALTAVVGFAANPAYAVATITVNNNDGPG